MSEVWRVTWVKDEVCEGLVVCVDTLVTWRDIKDSMEQGQTVADCRFIYLVTRIKNERSHIQDCERSTSSDGCVQHTLRRLHLLTNIAQYVRDDSFVERANEELWRAVWRH
jgi:hypothetical protein